MRHKLAFVIPWYGENIAGGADAECRGLAKALARQGLTVEILTTCVRDFRADWSENFHPAGTSLEGGIPVRRFRARHRDTAAFDRVNARLMRDLAVSAAEEEIYLRESVTSPDLCRYIDQHRAEYVFFFIPYLFGTTYWGSRVCPERSVLIPCLHQESYARLDLFRPMFEAVRGIVFHSPAEQRLAQRLYRIAPERSAVLGEPVACDWTTDPERFRRQYALSDFLLYAGRTDRGKNADLLVDYFERHLHRTRAHDHLVFIGGEPPAFSSDRVRALGFLPRQDQYDCYAAALALCVPGVKESFSLVMMESWLAGRPVIVNAACEVTTEFCRLSGGGLYFNNVAEFSEILVELRANSELAGHLGRQGRRFVLEHYSPDRVAAAYLRALDAWF